MVNNQQQATKLLAQTRMVNLDIRVTPHRSLNRGKGAMSEPDLLYETEADLQERLMEQGATVTAVRRIIIGRDN